MMRRLHLARPMLLMESSSHTNLVFACRIQFLNCWTFQSE